MTVPVELGKANAVKAILSQSNSMLIDKAQRNSVTTHVELTEKIKAPVSRGQRLGTLTVKSGQQILTQIPLVAESAVEKLSWWDIFVQLFKQFAMAKV
jgi:D-alanyl-D-alanine carboxypeptidase (penicillin-binding protein 5/6)